MRVSNGLLDNYKTALAVSAKPEKSTLIYILLIGFIGLIFLFYCIWVHASLLVFVLPFVWLFFRSLTRYYFLKHPKSVNSMLIDTQDRFFLTLCQKSSPVEVSLIDLLRLDKIIVLYFIETDESISKNNPLLQQYLYGLFQDILLFISLQRYVFIVSEDSVGKSHFRCLLRRLR